MRYLRRQVINRRSLNDARLDVDINNNILMTSPAAVQVPAGSTTQRPIVGGRYGTDTAGDLSGMIRYNTTTGQLEGYQSGTWRAFRFKESTQIVQQNLGAGDSSTLYFGPLNPAPPAVVQSGSSWGGQNLLVLVENVLQVSNTNYTVVQNPTITGEVYIGPTSTATNVGATTINFATSLVVSSVSGNGTSVTLTFSTQTANPFAIGQSITVTGLGNLNYNGTYTVSGVTTSTVSYANSTTGSVIGDGLVTSNSAIYPAISLVGALVTGHSSIPANTAILSYVTDPITDALISININKLIVTSTIPVSTPITITESTTTGSGYYIQFSSPPPYGKPVTVLSGFDQ